MHDVTQILIDHGYMALFVAVLAEQFGLPVPAAPFLIAAGALAGLEELDLTWAIALSVTAAMISDFVWFQLGRKKGSVLLQWFNRKSPEHQSYGAKLQSAYLRYGPQSLLVSKFIPLFNIVAPQAAGAFRLAPWKFFALDATATCLWTISYMALGWTLRSQLESIGPLIHRLEGFLALALLIALATLIFRRVCHTRLHRMNFAGPRHSA